MWLLWGVAVANPIPIYSFPYSCIDPRFPTLHKGWILGCNPRGMVTNAHHVESMRQQEFDAATEFVGLGAGILQGRKGLWMLEEERRYAFPRIQKELNAPPTGKDSLWAFTTEDGLGILEGRQLQEIAARPRGWYPPAWWGDSVVWVEDDRRGGEDLWIYSKENGPRLLRGGPEAQRHPVSYGETLAWLEGDTIGLWSLGDQKPTFWDANVVDRLAINAKRVCWSEQEKDIDIHCNDGFVLQRKGHQIWPSLWGDFLLFREEGQLMLYRMED